MIKYLLSLIFLFLNVSLFGQASIVFNDNNFDQALERAKQEKKDVFLDTYAPWCGPCKKMDVVFRDQEVANYFNKNFINVKVNVDAISGKNVANRYGIVFLPTMLIMDANGNVKQRMDGLLSSDELLRIGSAVAEPEKYAMATAVPIVKKEEIKAKPRPTKKIAKSTEVVKVVAPEIESDEKILFVLGDPNQSDNPDYLYHEAYFRMQQMDGSHTEIAKKYLASQEDWSTEKNMEFIVNFMDNTQSEMFQYFTENKEAFQEMMTASRYRKTLDILINRALYRQIPRPDMERVMELNSLLYPRRYEKISYQYMLERYEAEENYLEFVRLGEEFLEKQVKQDPMLLYKLGKYNCLYNSSAENKECIYRVEESLKRISKPIPDQYLSLAKLYKQSNKRKKAIEYAELAKEICKNDEALKMEISEFLAKLNSL